MTKNPWHVRLPSTEHYQWYRNLMVLHEMTSAWLREINVDRPAHLLTRGFKEHASEHLWMLDSLSEMSIEDLLVDMLPEDVLASLEQAIWVLQSWTLVHLFEENHAEHRKPLESLLEQVSWNLGRKFAEEHWNRLISQSPHDLREIMLALYDTPFSR